MLFRSLTVVNYPFSLIPVYTQTLRENDGKGRGKERKNREREKEHRDKPEVSRRKEIIKTRAEINEIEAKKTIAKINKAKSWFYEKINKIDKPLATLIKKKRERTEINKIRNGKGETTTDTAEIQRILRDCYKQLYDNKMDNHEEMDKFLERYNFPRLNQEELENINRHITSNEIETVIKNLPTN